MKWTYQKITTLLMLLIFAYLIVDNPLSNVYVEKLKADAVTVSNIKDSLYMEIAERAKDYERPPIDAKIDKVWKKMPGLNGLQVDIEASYEKMKESGTFDEDKLIYKEIPPKVSLGDLPPAPIFRGSPEKPMVALTVNVAWGNEYISSMLQTLKSANVKATFFIEGRWAKQNPDLVKMIADAGHEIGNHSYSHPNMQSLSAEEITKEIQDTNAILQATIEQTPKWFAPPSGSYNDLTVEIAHKNGMQTIMWTVDTIDWQRPSPSVIVNRVTKQVHNGAIVLMHPTEPTEQALGSLIEELKSKGYRIGSVGELMDEKRLN